MSRQLHDRYDALVQAVRKSKRLLVAFSGGCDSSLLIAVSRQVLGRDNILAVTAVSASLAGREKADCERIASRLDVEYQSIGTEEMNNPAYIANPSNRCFFCKDELFGRLAPIARAKGMMMADGFNASDRADDRPGYQASEKWGVLHPLNESGLTKNDIRALSRWMKLPTWNKPASPCLSSRIPYGTPVTDEALRKIEKAEEIVRAEGFRVVRVRHYGPEARIEVPRAEISRLISPERWPRVVGRLQKIGYARVLADPRGFKSGQLNQPTEKSFK